MEVGFSHPFLLIPGIMLTTNSYSITHDPTIAERELMDEWIRDLCAFVRDEAGHKYGTAEPDEYKVMTPEGTIRIQKDPRWGELLELAGTFSGNK